MAISPQQLTIYLYSAHRAVIFAIAQVSCYECYCTLSPSATMWIITVIVFHCTTAHTDLPLCTSRLTRQTLIIALVISQFDHCNAVMVGLTAYLTWRLHSAVSTQRSSSTSFNLCRSDHITECIDQPPLVTCTRMHQVQECGSYV